MWRYRRRRRRRKTNKAISKVFLNKKQASRRRHQRQQQQQKEELVHTTMYIWVWQSENVLRGKWWQYTVTAQTIYDIRVVHTIWGSERGSTDREWTNWTSNNFNYYEHCTINNTQTVSTHHVYKYIILCSNSCLHMVLVMMTYRWWLMYKSKSTLCTYRGHWPVSLIFQELVDILNMM